MNSPIFIRREREREKLSVTKLARTNVEGKSSLCYTHSSSRILVFYFKCKNCIFNIYHALCIILSICINNKKSVKYVLKCAFFKIF